MYDSKTHQRMWKKKIIMLSQMEIDFLQIWGYNSRYPPVLNWEKKKKPKPNQICDQNKNLQWKFQKEKQGLILTDSTPLS